MSTTLTLKNIPEALYNRLKQSAESHRRSMNNEILFCLESVLQPAALSAQERLERIRTLRNHLGAQHFCAEDIARYKEEGRS